MRNNITFLLALLCILSFQIASAQIAITEFINNVNGTESTDEWVELTNFSAGPVDIMGWSIADEDSDDDVIVATSFVIPAGGVIIIAKNKTAFETQWLGGVANANVLQVPGLTLSNGADEIIISDGGGLVIWSLAYQNDESESRATFFTDGVFTNTVWGSKASPGVIRNGNDPPTGTLGYQENDSTVDPDVITSTTGDIGSPSPSAALPVELIHFSVYENEQAVYLNWITASEINSDYFSIQHSTDGFNFLDLGQVQANGNSQVQRNYEYEIENLETSENYFRLMQVDLDGSFEWSDVIYLSKNQLAAIAITPNPAHDIITITGLTNEVQVSRIEILNSSGAMINNTSWSSNSLNQIDISALNSGIYIIRISTSEGISTKRFVKQ